MAYDQELAERLRGALAGQPGVVEKAMFGGLAFLVGGNMAVAASGQSGLLLRVDPDETEGLTQEANVERFTMGGRQMDGWLHIAAEAVVSDPELARWVAIGVARALALSPK